MPRDRLAPGEECLLLVEQPHEPLPGRDVLERPVPLLVEADRVLDGLRVALERPGFPEPGHHGLTRRRHGLPAKRIVGPAGRRGIRTLPARAPERHRDEPSVPPQHLAEREALLAPPDDVGHVAEGADHQDPGSLGGIGELAREDRHGHAEEGGEGAPAEEMTVTRVVGMRRDTHARREQLRPGRRDEEALRRALDVEGDVVEGAAHGTILHLRLGDGGLEVDVPHGGRLEAVDVALPEEIVEAQLGEAAGPSVDGRILLPPVDREPEPAPEPLEGLFVLVRDPLAELDEVRARDDARRLLQAGGRRGIEHEPRLVRRAGVTADVEEVLHPALRREAVVVPAHRVEDVSPPHALVARDDVGVGVAEDVPDVERPRDRRRWRVDDEGLVARPGRVVGVDSEPLPLALPARLGRRGLEVLGEMGRVDGTERRHPRKR